MLIKSISGIRGTIGGVPGEALTPPDVVKFATGYALWIKEENSAERPVVAIGRDARISGSMVSLLVSSTLNSLGVDVVDLGLSTTPTVELAVTELEAQGGIILTASHNPKNWNALKLLNSSGEFLSKAAGERVLELSETPTEFSEADNLGQTRCDDSRIPWQVDPVLVLDVVNPDSIRSDGLKDAVDGVNVALMTEMLDTGQAVSYTLLRRPTTVMV